jgi:hypothetical protein
MFVKNHKKASEKSKSSRRENVEKRQKNVRKKLKSEEREIFKDLKKYYKRIFRCKKCKRLYGSDFEKVSKICRICSKEIVGDVLRETWRMKRDK